MSNQKLILLLCLLGCCNVPIAAQSVLSGGDIYKFSVDKEGVYKITYDQLRNSGIDLSSLDPKKISIYGNKGGMLPQPLATARPEDLQENKIIIVGEDDGRFDPTDYILFYAYGPDDFSYNEETQVVEYQQNKYSRKNFYYLKIGSVDGIRIADQVNLGNDHFQINSYTDFFYQEDEERNLLHSGREWYGRFNSNHEKIFDLPFQDLSATGKTSIIADVMGQSTTATTIDVFLNNTSVGSLEIDNIVDFNNPLYTYNYRGKEDQDVFEVSNSGISEGSMQLKLKFNSNGGAIASGYYDHVLVQTERSLKYSGATKIMFFPQAKNQGLISVNITNASSGLQVWDVQDDYNPKNQLCDLSSSTIKFGTIGGAVKKYIVFNPSSVDSPVYEGIVGNQNLHGLSTPDLLIISHKDFMSEALRLQDFKIMHDGYDVATVELGQVYNEFSSGRADVVAIRDFIHHLYQNDPEKLKYVLLVGKGSYDYLGYDFKEGNTNYVPIYQSVNSLHPLLSYSSDDFYGFMENDEGIWNESYSGNHTLEVAVGRLPVTSISQLKAIVDKIIHYSSSPDATGSWRTQLTFVADDGDNNRWYSDSEQLADFVNSEINNLKVKKLYLGSFQQQKLPSGERSEKAQVALERAIDEGTLFINYIGHGGYKQWTDEEILTADIIDNFKNFKKLPFFITATCAFGRHDDPMFISAGEKLLLNPSGGGIGLVTTSRDVYANSNFELNKAFFNALEDKNGTAMTYGDIFRITKNNSLQNGVYNRNFSLLGDPSLRIPLPYNRIELENISANDTLKALQTVTIKGKITDQDGALKSSFNGLVEIKVADKPVEKRTLDDGTNASFTYPEFSSIIYAGRASVKNGSFSSSFIVPTDISHKIGQGQIYFYAAEEDGIEDATSAVNIYVGGTANNTYDDSEGPLISLFLEDSTFSDGDFVGSNALLYVRLADQSGINTTGSSIGTGLTAELDNQAIDLNNYFISNVDDYTSGSAFYPLIDLPSGKHFLSITASDVFNNISTLTVEFTVADDQHLIVDELYNYPNPVKDVTSFVFTHNRAGEPLEGDLTIFNNKGEKVLNYVFETEVGQVRHKIMEWDRRNIKNSNLGEGIYYYRLNVRSKLDGSRAEKIQKLILVN